MIPVLMYHRVAEIPQSRDPIGLATPPDLFEQQMRFLACNGYSCLTLAEAVAYFLRGSHAPAKSFVLTFDDGFQDVLLRACPILEKFGFTATIFLVAGYMGSQSNWWGQEQNLSGQLLTWDEARELARRGYILGSHTVSHPILKVLDSESAFKEIQSSKMLLQDQLKFEVDFFSYPYSASDARIEGLVKLAGYKAACGGESGLWSVFNLWRVVCWRDETTLSFALKASGWYSQRTALRASTPGQLLRRSYHFFRRRLMTRFFRHPDALFEDPDRSQR